MKNFVRGTLQKTFSFEIYLFLFSLYSIKTAVFGNYEKEFLHFIKIIKKDGIILDIGANIGITAAPLGKSFPKSKIHAYEPIPENFSTLVKVVNYLKIPNIKFFNMALGSEEGSLKMIMPIRGNSKMQGLSKAHKPGSNEEGVLYEVPLKTLDELYPDQTGITAIKIDVENFEFEVLRGGKKLLERNMPMIYCELWDNENRTNVFDLLTSLGYKTYIYTGESATLEQVDLRKKVPGSNFFFLNS